MTNEIIQLTEKRNTPLKKGLYLKYNSFLDQHYAVVVFQVHGGSNYESESDFFDDRENGIEWLKSNAYRLDRRFR